MAFFDRLASFTSGVAQALPGALAQRTYYQREARAREERGVEREKDQIRARFASDPEGAIREFEAKGYTDDAARLRGMLTGAERTKLQTASKGYQTEAAGATGALQAVASPELLATEKGRAEATQQLQPLIPRLAAGIGEARALGQQSLLGAAVGVSELAGGVAPMQQALTQLQQRLAQIQEPDVIASMIDPSMDVETLSDLKRRYADSLKRIGVSEIGVEAAWTRIDNASQRFRDDRFLALVDDLGRIGDAEGIRRMMSSTRLSSNAEAEGRARLRVAEIVSGRDVDEATRFRAQALYQEWDDAKLQAQFNPTDASGLMDEVISKAEPVMPDVAAMWRRAKPLWMQYGTLRGAQGLVEDAWGRYQLDPTSMTGFVGKAKKWDLKTMDKVNAQGGPSYQEMTEALEEWRKQAFPGAGQEDQETSIEADIRGAIAMVQAGRGEEVLARLSTLTPEHRARIEAGLVAAGMNVASESSVPFLPDILGRGRPTPVPGAVPEPTGRHIRLGEASASIAASDLARFPDVLGKALNPEDVSPPPSRYPDWLRRYSERNR